MNSSRCFKYGLYFLLGVINVQVVSGQDNDLTGLVTVNEIIENDHIFKIYVDRYNPDEKAIEYLNDFPDSVEVKVFFGNWCRESKKYIPGLVKTFNIADNDRIEVNYIAVDTQKKLPQEFLNMFEIEYIPTVVVLKGNVEAGRIVEKPRELIETDFVEILKKEVTKK